MDGVFAILLLVSLIGLAWGLARPGQLGRVLHITKTLSRLHAGLIMGSLVLLFFILVGVSAPPQQPTASHTPASQPAQAKPQVQTDSVVTKQETETKPVLYTTQTQDDSSLPQGQTKIIQAGVNGVETLTYSVTYTNGQQTAKTQISDNVTTQPTPEIVAYGTYVAPPPTTLAISFTCASAVDYSYGSVCVHTEPGAALTITVTYCSGYDATSGSLQGTEYANASGNYTWSWTPETKCRGAATATVSANWQGQSTTNSDNFTVQ